MRRLVSVLVLAFSVACGGGSDRAAPSAPSAPAPAPAARSPSAAEGSWNLSTVDGTALPYTRPDAVDPKIEVLGIALSIAWSGIPASGGSVSGEYSKTLTLRTTTRRQQFTTTVEEKGYWKLTGTTILLLDEDGIPSWGGSVTGNTMTLYFSWDERAYVYTK